MSTLPPGFETLEPFVDHWAVDGTANRDAARSASTAEQRSGFFAAMQPMTEAALALLDSKPFNEQDAAEQRLMNLCLSLAHVAMAVEAHGDDEPKHRPHREAMRITRAVADF